MRLGFLTSYSEERVQFAREAGFDCLELQAGPGSPLDALQIGNDLSRIKSTLDEQGIGVSALACYFNHLDEEHEAEHSEYFGKLIEMAPRLGCNVIATMSGVTAQSRASGNLDESIPD